MPRPSLATRPLGRYLRVLLGLAVIAGAVPAAPALAGPDDWEQAHLELLRENLRILRSILQEVQADPTLELVVLRDDLGTPPVLLPRREMLRWETWRYVAMTKLSGARFSRDDLAARIVAARDSSALMKQQLPEQVAKLEREIARFEKANAAALGRPRPPTGTTGPDRAPTDPVDDGGTTVPGPVASLTRSGATLCVEFVGVTRKGSIAEAARLSEASGEVRDTGQWERGWLGDVTLRWATPPKRICDGDVLQFGLEIVNHRQQSQDPGGTAAVLDVRPNGVSTITCSNADRYDPPTDITVMAPEPGRANQCTAQFRIFGFYTPAALFEVHLRGRTVGIIAYNYQRVNE